MLPVHLLGIDTFYIITSTWVWENSTWERLMSLASNKLLVGGWASLWDQDPWAQIEFNDKTPFA